MAISVFEKSLIKEYNQDVKINTSRDIVTEMQDIKDISKEIFIVFHLDAKNQIIKREIISIGILNSSLIHPREVFRNAIISNVNSIILAHNHPSGDTAPSEEDKTITEQLMKAGDILGIKVLDHIIVGTKNEHTSMREKELM
jgi:DNA repair protein RadC